MKKLKKKIYLGALVAGGALTFTACGNRPECVYGPPPEIPAQTEATIDDVTVETETDDNGFDVNGNIPEDVYGPPSYWEEEETGEVAPESFAEDENVPVLVYGPPSYFESSEAAEAETEEETAAEKTTKKATEKTAEAPTESYTNEENIPECVYGPPEYFNK